MFKLSQIALIFLFAVLITLDVLYVLQALLLDGSGWMGAILCTLVIVVLRFLTKNVGRKKKD